MIFIGYVVNTQYVKCKEDIRMEVYRHISGVTGTFNKTYRPTGLQEYYIMVNTFDGRQFYAPESQWKIIR